MAKPIKPKLSLQQARAVHLAAQGLLRPPRRKARKEDVLAEIRRMGALQIDTISVVARSPYLVLWSRLGAYRPEWLDELLAEGRLFEYWSHAACFLPIEAYPLYRRAMIDRVHPWWKRVDDWLHKHRADVEVVLERIRREGARKASDFEPPAGWKAGTWWSWKPQKLALELLHTAGELMIARREAFQRVYDVRERVLPAWDDAHLLSREESDRAFVLATVRALGIASPSWVADYFRMKKRAAAEAVTQLLREGKLLRAKVGGIDGEVLAHPDHEHLLAQAAAGELKATFTTLLSPFDPVVWDRRRASELFGFDYRIECYTPAPKRVYGYYTLPILRRGSLIGRLDAKAHRREGRFEVKAIYLEHGIRQSDALVRDVAAALSACAQWHGTPDVVLKRAVPAPLGRALRAQLLATV